MGYGVEQLHETASYLSTFATEEAGAGYHSVETLEADLRRLAEENSEIAELHEIGRSVENRPIWALRLGERRGSTLCCGGKTGAEIQTAASASTPAETMATCGAPSTAARHVTSLGTTHTWAHGHSLSRRFELFATSWPVNCSLACSPTIVTRN